jgi:hypothetical protein
MGGIVSHLKEIVKKILMRWPILFANRLPLEKIITNIVILGFTYRESVDIIL